MFTEAAEHCPSLPSAPDSQEPIEVQVHALLWPFSTKFIMGIFTGTNSAIYINVRMCCFYIYNCVYTYNFKIQVLRCDNSIFFLPFNLGPGWYSLVYCVPVCEPKSCWFDFQSGHMTGLQTRSLVEERVRGNHTLLFLFLSFALLSLISKKKLIN